MSDQQNILPGELTRVGEHRGYIIWQNKDGHREAYKAAGHDEDVRPRNAYVFLQG